MRFDSSTEECPYSRGKEYPMRINRLALFTVIFATVLIGSIGVGVGSTEKNGSATNEAVASATNDDAASVQMNPNSAYTVMGEVEAALAAQQQAELDAFFADVARKEQAKAVRSAPSTPNYDPGDGSRWDQLAKCECGGNWGCNTGNGFGGGLQFMHQRSYSTWLSYGGGEFAPHPWEASREQQIVIAERVLAGSGWKAWPGCSRKFGWL
jgi:hypothetical protein